MSDQTMKATIDRYAHLAGHLENLTTSGDFGFNIAREFWSAMKLGQAEIDAKDKRIAELEHLTPRPVDAAAGGVPEGEDVFAFDGETWHKARHYGYRSTENDFLCENDDYDDRDDEGIVWIEKGWYATNQVDRVDYDVEFSRIKNPVTHWMPPPPAPARTASDAAR